MMGLFPLCMTVEAAKSNPEQVKRSPEAIPCAPEIRDALLRADRLTVDLLQKDPLKKADLMPGVPIMLSWESGEDFVHPLCQKLYNQSYGEVSDERRYFLCVLEESFLKAGVRFDGQKGNIFFDFFAGTAKGVQGGRNFGPIDLVPNPPRLSVKAWTEAALAQEASELKIPKAEVQSGKSVHLNPYDFLTETEKLAKTWEDHCQSALDAASAACPDLSCVVEEDKKGAKIITITDSVTGNACEVKLSPTGTPLSYENPVVIAVKGLSQEALGRLSKSSPPNFIHAFVDEAWKTVKDTLINDFQVNHTPQWVRRCQDGLSLQGQMEMLDSCLTPYLLYPHEWPRLMNSLITWFETLRSQSSDGVKMHAIGERLNVLIGFVNRDRWKPIEL